MEVEERSAKKKLPPEAYLQPCKYFARRKCKRGKDCPFNHTLVEESSSPADSVVHPPQHKRNEQTRRFQQDQAQDQLVPADQTQLRHGQDLPNKSIRRPISIADYQAPSTAFNMFHGCDHQGLVAFNSLQYPSFHHQQENLVLPDYNSWAPGPLGWPVPGYYGRNPVFLNGSFGMGLQAFNPTVEYQDVLPTLSYTYQVPEMWTTPPILMQKENQQHNLQSIRTKEDGYVKVARRDQEERARRDPERELDRDNRRMVIDIRTNKEDHQRLRKAVTRNQDLKDVTAAAMIRSKPQHDRSHSQRCPNPVDEVDDPRLRDGFYDTKTLFVGGLEKANITEADLRKFFTTFGEIESVKMIKASCAFITFMDIQSANQVVRSHLSKECVLNETPLQIMLGNKFTFVNNVLP